MGSVTQGKYDQQLPLIQRDKWMNESGITGLGAILGLNICVYMELLYLISRRCSQ